MSVSIPKNLFPDLSPSLKKELEESGHIKQFKAGEVMLRENAGVNTIPIVLSGTLKIMREEPDGREILLYYIHPGESCVMSVFAGLYNSPSKIKAVAEENAEVLMFPSNKVKDWIKKYPEWTDFILFVYHKRFEELLEVVNDVAFQRTDERVLGWLKKKASMIGANDIITTHQQIADELGSSREVISRLLKQLEKENKIILNRNKITLK
jgi:CRP/FNR family transcriptional regulator, anaerobic regulatory protein